jgi:hypothetical protein
MIFKQGSITDMYTGKRVSKYQLSLYYPSGGIYVRIFSSVYIIFYLALEDKTLSRVI